MRDALAVVGCATYRELTQQPRAVRDRFHAEWTARMHQRCGIDPRAVAAPRGLDNFRRKAMGRDAINKAVIVQAYAEKVPPAVIAERCGVSERTVFRIARAEGLLPHVRTTKDRVRELHDHGMDDQSMAYHLRVSRQRITEVRNALGLPPHSPATNERPMTAEQVRRAVRASEAASRAERDRTILALSAQGLTQPRIAERFGITRIRVAQILGAHRKAA